MVWFGYEKKELARISTGMGSLFSMSHEIQILLRFVMVLNTSCTIVRISASSSCRHCILASSVDNAACYGFHFWNECKRFYPASQQDNERTTEQKEKTGFGVSTYSIVEILDPCTLWYNTIYIAQHIALLFTIFILFECEQPRSKYRRCCTSFSQLCL